MHKIKFDFTGLLTCLGSRSASIAVNSKCDISATSCVKNHLLLVLTSAGTETP